jgi:hypothetical protein
MRSVPFVLCGGTVAVCWRIIVAIGFERIPVGRQRRRSAASLAPYSLSLDVQWVPSRDRRSGGRRQGAVARTSFPPLRDRRRYAAILNFASASGSGCHPSQGAG